MSESQPGWLLLGGSFQIILKTSQINFSLLANYRLYTDENSSSQK